MEWEKDLPLKLQQLPQMCCAGPFFCANGMICKIHNQEFRPVTLGTCDDLHKQVQNRQLLFLLSFYCRLLWYVKHYRYAKHV